MLQNSSVAQFLTKRLNVEGTKKGIAFKIFADAGFYEGSNTIQGVLAVLTSESSPIVNFTSHKIQYSLSFEVVDHNVGAQIQIFNEVVTAVFGDMQGKTYKIDGGEATFTFDIPRATDVSIKGAMGLSINSKISVTVEYCINAVTTNNKIWLLDNVVIPYTDESVEIEVQGQTNNVYGQNATQSLPIGQTKLYHFTLPFDSSNSICALLQKDMLNGDMTKTYSLKYYDGISFTSVSPFETTVSLFRTTSSGATKPKVSSFSVVFTDVDDGGKGNILYEIALIDNPFDAGSANVRYFKDRKSQQDWYASKVAIGAPYSHIKAPNLENLMMTQQIYILPSNCAIELNGLLTKNYAIIRSIDKLTNAPLCYYYYYIQSASVGANNQIMVSLSLDTIQTYYFDPNIKIADCIIERAHLNRWINYGSGTVRFDNRVNSELFIQEDIPMLSKRLIRREKASFAYGWSEINEWMAENIMGYQYIYVSDHAYKFYETATTPYYYNPPLISYSQDDTDFTNLPKSIRGSYVVLCVPYYKSYKRIHLSVLKPITSYLGEIWGTNAVELFRMENNDASFFYSSKISMLPPFEIGALTATVDHGVVTKPYEILENGDLWIKINDVYDKITDNKLKYQKFKNLQCYRACTTDYSRIVSINYQNLKKFPLEEIDTKTEVVFNKIDIINSKYSDTYNPKLISEKFKSLTITAGGGDRFDYDLQKIVDNNRKLIPFVYFEAMTPDVTKANVVLHSLNYENSIFVADYENDFNGLLTSQDNSLPLANNKLSEMLSQQKNYYMAWGMNQGVGFMKNTVSSNSIRELANGVIDTSMNYMNREWSLDNMRQAPETLKSVNGNTIFCRGITEIGVWIALYEALPCEKNLYAQIMFKNGFKYGLLGNVKNYDNIRRYFNFVQAQVESINGISISNDARNDIRRRFGTGIRFWNSDDIQYEQENYENWLAN